MDGQDLAAYKAARERVGLIALADRGKIHATGPDRVSFLHNMISNDVEKLEEMSGRHSTFLTARGKIVAEFHIYKLPYFLLLDLDSKAVGKTVATLGKYIIMDEVALSDCSSQWAHFSLQGPRSTDLLKELAGSDLPSEHLQARPATWQSTPIWVIHKADLAKEGFEVLLPAGQGDTFRQAALESGRGLGIRQVGELARQALRVEAAIPLYGAEVDESRYPMEARLDDALDFSKGCYIGQEVVAKATYIGGVARLLVQLQMEGRQVPPAASRLLDPTGNKAGTLTSSAYSPGLGHPIALGYVKKKYAQPGQTLEVSVADGETIQAQVVERFL